MLIKRIYFSKVLTERSAREGGKEYRYVLYIHNCKMKYYDIFLGTRPQPAITCSKQIIEKIEQKCEICSKLTIKTPKRRHLRRVGVFIVNFEHISHLCFSVSIVKFEQVNAGWDISPLAMWCCITCRMLDKKKRLKTWNVFKLVCCWKLFKKKWYDNTTTNTIIIQLMKRHKENTTYVISVNHPFAKH